MKKVFLLSSLFVVLSASAAMYCHCIGELTFLGLTIYKYEKYVTVKSSPCPDGCAPVNGIMPPGIVLNPFDLEKPIPEKISVRSLDLENNNLLFSSEENNVKSVFVTDLVELNSLNESYPNISINKGTFEANEEGIIVIPFIKK
jgi:hypothetical protein